MASELCALFTPKLFTCVMLEARVMGGPERVAQRLNAACELFGVSAMIAEDAVQPLHDPVAVRVKLLK